ncbi:MAG: hypothetical protein M1828_006098 [Chrysothrix sp. TS-e1954]|nr:MAG: hypothetical protein M1828_006098 [Chrysothrix sp. TS-e1954]
MAAEHSEVNGHSSNRTPSSPELDVERLHSLPSEQQDLYLLTFTSDLARYVAGLDSDGATTQQSALKKELFKIINLPSPAPTRVIRNNLANCFAVIFTKGERKQLFETINELIGLLSTGKGDKDSKARHAAVHCLGATFEAAGDSAISLFPLACNTLLKQIKPAQNNAGFRAAIIKALGCSFKVIGDSADEAVCRDIWKQIRPLAASNKSLLVQRNACWCLEQMFQLTSHLDNSNDFEKLQQTIWKVMDSPSPSVRHAAASCIGAVYVKSYTPTPTPMAISKTKKKPKPKINEDGAEGDERPASPALAKLPTSLAFSLPDILRSLFGQYTRPNTSSRVRAAIASTCIRIFKGLDVGAVEEHYDQVARVFLNDLLGSISILHNRYRLLTTRKFVRIILVELIGKKLLGESAQLHAITFWINDILKDYPQTDVKERPEPTKEAIVAALDVLRGLIESLGSAANSVAEICRSAIYRILEHPSFTVQIHASRCLRTFVLACPQQLLPSITICLNSVTREVGQLSSPRRSTRRCLGYAHGLAAAISTSRSQPLHGSPEVYARVLNQATAFLKSSSSSDLRISSTQIHVAWTMIGGLMSLGPNFVKLHLSQLLLLWKNALPKPLKDDNIAKRGLLELSFLTHVRECALSSMRVFLAYNSRLLTVDVSKRLATMLQNTVDFLTSMPGKKTTEDFEKLLSPSLQLQDFDVMLRRRLYDCYTQLLQLSPRSSHDMLLQSSILSLATTSFADPDSLSSTSLSSSIATSSGNFESIWDVGDNSGFGITSLVNGLAIESVVAKSEAHNSHWLIQEGYQAVIDHTIHSPICGSAEYDSARLYFEPDHGMPAPLSTGVVDAAIRLFATCLPFQSKRVQQGALEQLSALVAPDELQKSPARDVAIIVNSTTALLYTLQVTQGEVPSLRGSLKSQDVEKAMQDLLHRFVTHSDQSVRHLAAKALGRLSKTSASDFASREISFLVDLIVSNRDPNVRAGCAVALGCITSELGGMAAGFHLKNILGILTSLASDPHPVVHFWSLDALSKVSDSAGLAFSTYVSSTLGMLAQLYVAESHGEETNSLASSNIEVDLPTLTVLARSINSVINVLGPDLQDMSKTRNMLLTLTYQLQTEVSASAGAESMKCLGNLSMYAPGNISFSGYLRQLQHKMMSDEPGVRHVALMALYNAMRRGAEDVIREADSGFEERIWLVLNESYGQGIIRDLVREWVQQSGLQSIALWIQRIQVVLTRTHSNNARSRASVSKPVPRDGDPETQDEEVAGFAASAAQTSKDDPTEPAQASQELLRWQVRAVAMESLNEILSTAAQEAARDDESTVIASLQPRIADIIRIAFAASTASVVDLRVQGIQIIGTILTTFGRVPDPDFPEATLLEQYQAQISSALTPAFAADSSPELAAEAIGICALFISAGIVTNIDRMGRILRLLSSGLEDFSKDKGTSAIGELKGLSSNAQTMVKLAVYSAWADLQIASREQKYLEKVVQPHLKTLTPLWLASLREYAHLKFEPDISMAGAPTVGPGAEYLYAALNRETLLTFYQATWLRFVDAIASLIDEDTDFVLDALDDKAQSSNDEATPKDSIPSKGLDINYRHEPVAFFFVLFGISFEALASGSKGDPSASERRTRDILSAIQTIVRPSVAGFAIYQDAIFSETMDLFDRMILMEGLEVQTTIVEIARDLCMAHPSARKVDQPTTEDGDLSTDIEQMFELTRIIVLAISRHIPNLSDRSHPSRKMFDGPTIDLVTLSLEALVSASTVFPSIIRSDLQQCILHVFSSILAIPNTACQDALVPQSLPVFRRFVNSLTSAPQAGTQAQLRTNLDRLLAILKAAQTREAEAAVACEKNTLLACTILVSSSLNILNPDDPLLARFITDLMDCLDSRLTTKVAAGLSRSLLMLPVQNAGKAKALLSASRIASMMLPHLLKVIAMPSEVEGTSEARSIIAQALVSFAIGLVDTSQRSGALSLVVPALLKRASAEGQDVWKETSTRLIECATKDSANFRQVVGGLDSDSRVLLENIIRRAGGEAGKSGGASARSEEDGDSREPSIALKMTF